MNNGKLEKICLKLQSIPENEFTKTILIPLLKNMGFLKVEFYGGTDEEGKDILIWEKDNFGDLRLSVAQVKHFKFSSSSGHSKSLQTIINQLIMCFNKSVHYSDKTVHKPYEVILISSHSIDSKNIKSRFDLLPNLIDKKIRIIDGIQLAEYLISKCPDVLEELLDEEIDYRYYSENDLKNDKLLKALRFNEEVSIKNIYTDIDFSLGKQTTKLFFNYTFNGKISRFYLNRLQWEKFNMVISNLNEYFVSQFLSPSLLELENTYEEQMKDYNKWNRALDLYKQQIEKKYNVVLSDDNDLNERIKTNEQIAFKKMLKKYKELNDIEPILIISFEINGVFLENWFCENKSILINKLEVFNKFAPNQNELKEYLNYCLKVFNTSNQLLKIDEFKKCLNINDNIVARIDLNITRFKLSIDKVFNTGLNLTLLGDAGGGKTTSLQMYALSKKADQDKIIIWSPLPQLVAVTEDKDHDSNYKIENFDILICDYLRTKRIKISNAQFKASLKTKNMALLLDGLDEAIKSNEWLIYAINLIAKKYAKLQVIVSSRISGEFVEQLNFFTVTLLPFTAEQRNQFIDKWFEDKYPLIVNRIKKHFEENKAIDEITRNPLLTTTLCVLAKHNLPLPQTEITLYNDRLKLLTGYYDNVKNIKVRISTAPQNLEFLSRKIAYYLHSKNSREDSLQNLEKIAVDVLKNRLDLDASKLALQELIDPCTILIPMSENGMYGFGHLRYQEHLVAIELATNRSINIESFFNVEKLNWWRECLYFFAQMSDDLTWLVMSIRHRINNPIHREIIQELIRFRPKDESKKIISIMHKFLGGSSH